MKKIKLGKFIINEFSLPLIIAEIGVNHNCNLSLAKKIILKAKQGGAHVVKFQTYKAELIASKFAKSYWDKNKEKTSNQHELFKKYDKFGIKDYRLLHAYCKKINIEFCSTPFDIKSVDELNPLLNFYKISSSDITNTDLIKKIASKKKPVLLSTGASNILEIKQAVKILNKNGCKNIVIMHCILNYPTKNSDANLRMITSLKKTFPKNIIGYSDHTLPSRKMDNLCTAYLLGAKIIEKHFTHNKKLKGNDHYHAMDKKDLKNFFNEIKKIKIILGNYTEKKMISSEKISKMNARRSAILNLNLNKGSILKKGMIIFKRPGYGIQPNQINKFYGKKIKKNLKEDTILKANYFF